MTWYLLPLVSKGEKKICISRSFNLVVLQNENAHFATRKPQSYVFSVYLLKVSMALLTRPLKGNRG